MSDKTLYVAVGVPGSGKSTWWETAKEMDVVPKNSVRINMDTIRKDITGSEEDQSRNNEVFKVASMNLDNALSREVEVIYWDNTSVKRKDRRKLVEKAKNSGYKTVAVFFNVERQICVDRASKRQRKVSAEVIDRMLNFLGEGPTYSEGWDEILEIKYGYCSEVEDG